MRRTLLPFSIIALIAMLLPSALRAELVEFDEFGFAVTIPSGWNWDTTSIPYSSGDPTVLNAVDESQSRYFSVAVISDLGSTSTDPTSLAQGVMADFSITSASIVDSFHTTLSGITVMHIYASIPKKHGEPRPVHMVFGAAHGYGYVLMSGHTQDRPENDRQLGSIIRSFMFTEPTGDGESVEILTENRSSWKRFDLDIIDYLAMGGLLVVPIIIFSLWRRHRRNRNMEEMAEDTWEEDENESEHHEGSDPHSPRT